MNSSSKKLSVLLIALLFLITACKANIARNADGSLTVETSISQQELQSAISGAIADPLVKNITVTLQSGFILVSGEHERLNDNSKTDTLTFRLDLAVSNGQLTSTISNALLDGKPIEQNRVDNWNQTIANRIAKIGQKRPNTTIQSVSITPNAVTMTWKLTK